MTSLLLGFFVLLAATHSGYAAVKGGIVQEPAQVALDDLSRPISFGYEAPSPYVKSVREEVKDPFGRVRGTYTVADPQGHAKVVNYASDEGGVRAAVQTSEPHVKGHAPAQIVTVPGAGTIAAIQEPVVVDPVSQAALSGVGALQQQEPVVVGGLGGGPGTIQFALGDPLAAKGFVSRSRDPMYRMGLSRVPYGLSGLDYYSYPASLYTPRGVKTVVSKGGPAGLRGLGGIGALGAGTPGIQYTLGDPLTGRSYAIRNPFYRSGQSLIPYGLSGLDYYSYPTSLYTPSGVKTVVTKTSPGGIAGLGGIGSLAGRKGGLGAPGTIQYTLGDPRSLYRAGQSLIPYGLSGLDYYSYPSYISPRTVLSKANTGLGGLGGIGALGSGAKGLGGLSAGPSIQFALGDPTIGGLGGIGGRKGGATVYDPLTRRLYRVGPSRMPFGLSGLDYSSYPRDLSYLRPLMSTKGGLGAKGFGGSDIQQGIADIGFGGAAPQVVDYAVSDPLSGGVKRVRKVVYRNGQSTIPYGLSGFDYYSYPNNLLNRLSRKGLAKAAGRIVSPFARQGIVEEAIVDPVTGDVLGKKVTKTVSDPLTGGLGGPGSVQFTLGDQQSKLGSPFAPAYALRRSMVPYGLTGLDYYSYPAQLQRQRIANAVQQRLADSALAGLSDPLEQRRVIGGAAAPGNIHFTLGVASGVAGGLRRVNVYDPTSVIRPVQRRIVTSPVIGAGVPNIQFTLGDSSLGGGLGAAAPAVVRKTTVTRPAVDPVLQAAGLAAPEPVVVKEVTVAKPSGVLASPAYGQRTIGAGGLGGGPGSIQFTLGDSALAGTGLGGSRVAYADPITAQAPIAIADPAVQSALGDPAFVSSPLGSAAPARIVQQEVVSPAGALDPTSQLAIDDPAALGSGLPGGDLLRTTVTQQLPGAGPGGSTVTKVTETVQEKVGGDGIFGGSRPRIITYTPRMSYLIQPRYDIPYSSLGGSGIYGLRSSPLRSPLAQQQVEQVLVK